MSTSSSSTFSPPIPTPEKALALFKEIEAIFPSASLGEDKWYIVALSALIATEPIHAATLYTYLLSQPPYVTPGSEPRKALIRRFRECLFKSVSIQGAPKPLEALLSIIRIEKEEDKDFSFSRENWQPGGSHRSRGDAWFSQIYQSSAPQIDALFSPAHADFHFANHEITYGLFLSDFSILGPVETELVVLPGIMMQNLPVQTGWHLRGLRRTGVSVGDVEDVVRCVEAVARFGGVGLGRLPVVGDVEGEFWGLGSGGGDGGGEEEG